MKKSRVDSIQIHHAGTFLLLLTLAVMRPEGFFPGVGLPVGPLCLLAALVILPWKIHSTLGLPDFWKRYRLPLLLVLSYQLLCIASLLYNMDRYTDLAELFRWGVVFIAGQMLLPLCIFIFLLPGKPPRLSRFSLVFMLVLSITVIPVSVLLQVYFPDVAAFAIRYFVGGDMISTDYLTIRGVLATSTDLGAILAILCWTALALASHNARDARKAAIFFALWSALFAYVGILSASRNFILFIAIATVSIVFITLWVKQRILIAPTLLGLTSLFYASAYTLPNALLYKLGRFIPYFEKVRTDTEISLKDLPPHASLESLGPRAPLWESTLKLIADNPLIGISNGGFRLAEDCSCYRGNTHNILFQSAIDAGVLGVIVVSLLLGFTIAKSARDKWMLSLLFGVVATLMVDNFTDHSYAWIVIASFTGVMLYRRDQNKSAQTEPEAYRPL